MVTGLFMIAQVVIGEAWAAAMAGLAGLGLVMLWFVLPIYSRLRAGE
jgi:hypothetical protein